MTLPNFLIIGTGKAGTTSLYHYLQQHPQIYMSPIKEPKFFGFGEYHPVITSPQIPNYQITTSLAEYKALFAAATNETALGEASTYYLSLEKAAQRIYHYLPHVKLIAILRQPVERAYSHFLMNIRNGTEPYNFLLAWQKDQQRRTSHWVPGYSYRYPGYYAAHLQRYLAVFPRQQLLIFLYEDWQNNPQAVLQRIFRFLQVDETFEPNLQTKYNVGRAPKSPFLHALLTRPNGIRRILHQLFPITIRQHIGTYIMKKNLYSLPKLDIQLRQQLTEVYIEDIKQLQQIVGRDLSHWLVKKEQ